MNQPLGESLMNDPFLATPEPTNRKDIDQALSLLQLSGGSGSQVCGGLWVVERCFCSACRGLGCL